MLPIGAKRAHLTQTVRLALPDQIAEPAVCDLVRDRLGTSLLDERAALLGIDEQHRVAVSQQTLRKAIINRADQRASQQPVHTKLDISLRLLVGRLLTGPVLHGATGEVGCRDEIELSKHTNKQEQRVRRLAHAIEVQCERTTCY